MAKSLNGLNGYSPSSELRLPVIFVPTVIQQILIECPLSAKHCAGHGDIAVKKEGAVSTLREFII